MPSLWCPLWQGTPPRAVWGRQESRATRTFRCEPGKGPLRAVEPFFTKASFAGRSTLEETPRLLVPPARALPLPARSAEARLRPKPGRGLLPREPSASPRGPPGLELRSLPQRVALLSSGGRGPAAFLQPGRTESRGGGRGSFRLQARRAGAGETRPPSAVPGARGPLETSSATRSSATRLSQPAERRGPAGGPGRRLPWRCPRLRADAWDLGGSSPDRLPPCRGWVADVPPAAFGRLCVPALSRPRCCLGAAAAKAPR